MLETIGNLADHWHVIALSTELKNRVSLKRKIYSIPLLIWRDQQGQVHALLDCCAHKAGPLQVADFEKNRIVCQYHGWVYDQTGKLIQVPSDPQACQRLNCSVRSWATQELDGFVWLFLGEKQPPTLPDWAASPEKDWRTKPLTKTFETNEELLVENFMDATHTAVVHDGLIRSQNQSVRHQLTVTTQPHRVLVEFAEIEERIGPGLHWIFGKSMKIRHSDEFHLPNLVRVRYQINGVHRFIALIACTPVEPGKTLALIQLRFRFGWLNPLVSLRIGSLAQKVLQQDFEVTQQQYQNQEALPERREHLVAADYIASQVLKVRRHAKANLDLPGEIMKQIELFS